MPSKLHIPILLCFFILSKLESQQLPSVLWHNSSCKPVMHDANAYIHELSNRNVSTSIKLVLIHFRAELKAEQKQKLLALGIEIHAFVPHTSYIMSVKQDRWNSLLELGATAIADILPEHKLSEPIYYGEMCSEAVSGKSQFMVSWFTGADLNYITRILAKHSAILIKYSALDQISIIECKRSELIQIAADTRVEFLSCLPGPAVPDDREGRFLHRVNQVGANVKENLMLDGAGVKVCIRDDGMVGPHIDFQNRKIDGTFGNIGNHGDMTSGIACGAGNIDPSYEGMAPGATLYTLNYQADFLDGTEALHTDQGVVLTNTSYSDGCNVGYTLGTQVVDRQLWDNKELMHVFSAGNSNNLDCGYGAGPQWGNITGGHKIAKNATTVANIKFDGTVEISSSRGPTKDGRMKPEVSARGTDELSTDENNQYQVGGGTSAAAPGVMGTMALLYQAYKQKHMEQNPPGGLIKAILMNTASDLGTPGPDYIHGMGMIDAYRAYQCIQTEAYQLQTLHRSETKQLTLNIPANVKKAKLLLYWPESPSTPLSSRALINDLNLVLHDSRGGVVYPMVLDHRPNSITLGAGAKPGIDSMNNFEQIILDQPIAGTYTVQISASSMPDDEVQFYFLEDYEPAELRLSAPIGGEKFQSGDASAVYFTTNGSKDSVEVRISIDEGSTWRIRKKVPSSAFLLPWSVPIGVNSNRCIVEIQQGSEIVRSDFFTTSTLVNGLKLKQFCPNEIQLTWDKSAKDSFLLYKLGDKYMEPFATSVANSISIPITNPRDLKWVSVAGYKGDVLSKRSKAIEIPETLVNCPIDADAKLNLVSASTQQVKLNCDITNIDAAVKIYNLTANPIDSFIVGALSSEGVRHHKFIRRIKGFDSLSLSVNNIISSKGSGDVTIPVWIDVVNDGFRYNDTSQFSFYLTAVKDKIGVYPLVEGFDSDQLPSKWEFYDPVHEKSWAVSQVKSISNIESNAIYYSNRTFGYIGTKTYLYSQTLDLNSAIEPYLYFNLAYHMDGRALNFLDSLKIKVVSVCGSDESETQIIQLYSNLLSTVDTSSSTDWSPQKAADWQKLSFDLSEFKGKKIVILLETTKGMNHDLFIDDFVVKEREHTLPNYKIDADPDDPCVLTATTIKEENPSTSGEHYWDFGPGAVRKTGTGAGPFTVRYTNGGDKKIVEKVTEANKTYFIVKDIKVFLQPIASFATTIQGKTVQFKNNSLATKNVFWDFGDGTNSSEENPIHVFPDFLKYNVRLVVSNSCNSSTTSKVVDLTTVGVHEPGGPTESLLNVYPQPADDEVNFVGMQKIESLILKNLQGQQLMQVYPQSISYRMHVNHVPAGIYLLDYQLEGGLKQQVKISIVH
ncbi:MAG TPA: S8 family serine peptidase [Saprospiraceae bacterium]|nr:S8 family serine peptidase [Saprospiraceae bacterium]